MITQLKKLWSAYKLGMKAHESLTNCKGDCEQGRKCDCKKMPVSQQADKVYLMETKV